MKILAHYSVDQSQAYGIWWYDPKFGLQNLYNDETTAQAARGRTIMYAKTNDGVSWENWFDSLVERPPYFESWVAYDSMDMNPKQFLAAISVPVAS